MKKLLDIWKLLNTPIYTGERLRDNLRALTAVSYFTAALGLVLLAANIATGQASMIAPSAACFLAGVACAYCAGVLKNRELAALIPTIFCLTGRGRQDLPGLLQNVRQQRFSALLLRR